MEYGIRELAEMAGVSARTLRYYDEIGLLKPLYTSEAGYRFYGEEEVSLLQQILFYRERGMNLERISNIVHGKDFDVLGALYEHLDALKEQQEKVSRLIAAVEKTIRSMKGEVIMENKEKFQAFKERMVKEKEEAYGEECRSKYGDGAVDESNKRLLDMTEADYERFCNLGEELKKRLEENVKDGEDPRGEAGRRIVLLHKEWLGFTWKSYSRQAHKGVAELYVQDERFKAYYDENMEGCAGFLCEAVSFWAEKL